MCKLILVMVSAILYLIGSSFFENRKKKASTSIEEDKSTLKAVTPIKKQKPPPNLNAPQNQNGRRNPSIKHSFTNSW